MQWYEVLLREIEQILAAHGAAGLGPSVFSTALRAGPASDGGKPHCLYKTILRTGFAAAFAEHGLTPSTDEIDGIGAHRHGR